MTVSLRLVALVLALVISAPASADPIDALSIGSDAWLRAGPSTSHERITGLPRGTAVLEIADLETAFKRRGRRWVQVHVLEGRHAGKQGWVWGEFVDCCETHEWLEQ
ncbi:MAG: SH3 domain-containing protein [Pseudomonadota bacterium]